MVGLLATGCEAENVPGSADSDDAGLTDAEDASDPEAVGGITADQLTGDYYFVVSTHIAPKAPVVFLAQIRAERVDDHLVLSVRQQPLAKADRTTPVAWWGGWQMGTIDAEGRFDSDTIAARIPAESNALTPFDTDAEIALHGMLSDAFDVATHTGPVEFMCGSVTGSILRPIPVDDLAGSTFTATRIADIADPSTYPAVVINCRREPARPL